MPRMSPALTYGPGLADWQERINVDRLRDAARHFDPASAWGYADAAAVLTIEIGHGVGLHQYELPVINRQWSLDYPQVFEPGQVIAL